MTGEGHGTRRGVAAEELRRHNLSAVLERLHLGGPATRSQLTAATGLNRSTIAALVGELSATGLVEEGPAPTTTGPGRPSPFVQVRPESAVALAVELAVDSMAVAAIGLGGHIFNRIRIARARGHYSPSQTVADVAQLAGPVLASLPVGHDLIGVGVAVAGITRRSDGMVHQAPNLGWREIPLAALLEEALGTNVPILVGNEADLGALGEIRRGGHPPVRNLIYVHGEVGIGTGIIADGKPLIGAAGYSGEAGHTLVNPNGEKCRCGSIGCWETEAGEAAVLRRMGRQGKPTGLRVLDSIEEHAAAGDAETIDALTEVAGWLGVGIGNLINVLNPELIVLGGMYARLFPYLEATVVDHAMRRALPSPGALASIVPSRLAADTLLVGAAEAVLSEVLNDPAGSRGSTRLGRLDMGPVA